MNYIMIDGKKIEINEETAKNLREQFTKKTPRNGDIVLCEGLIRIIIVTSDEEIIAYNMNGSVMANGIDVTYFYNKPDSSFINYKVIGNIFDDYEEIE